MDTFHHLVKAILVIVILYLLAIMMRRRGILTEDHSLVLARIVTDLCLPAIVFVSLAGQSIAWNQLFPAFVMLFLEVGCIALAWIASIMLKFSRPQQGAIVLCSAFGSSTFLGYSIIAEMFPHQIEAMTEAVLISEIGVGYPIFILGPVLAMYFGSEKSDMKAAWKSALSFFRSPVFFAMILGLLWGVFSLPCKENAFLAPFFQVCHVLASALTPLAILSVGLMFKIPDVRKILVALSIVIFIKLLLKPVCAGMLSSLFHFPTLWRDVLVLMAGMPSAVLGAVFLRRYGGDASLASALLLAASLASTVTLLIVFRFIG
ncbi:MAG: AEC family transporter [Deltaproteobacteria bacterium]|nr:AEC family transporter [Deltaproteobacteria bacterium]